jgi:hypothetical protein
MPRKAPHRPGRLPCTLVSILPFWRGLTWRRYEEFLIELDADGRAVPPSVVLGIVSELLHTPVLPDDESVWPYRGRRDHQEIPYIFHVLLIARSEDSIAVPLLAGRPPFSCGGVSTTSKRRRPCPAGSGSGRGCKVAG